MQIEQNLRLIEASKLFHDLKREFDNMSIEQLLKIAAREENSDKIQMCLIVKRVKNLTWIQAKELVDEYLQRTEE